MARPLPVLIATINLKQPALKSNASCSEVTEQDVIFVMFQLVILQEDTLPLDFFGQIANRFIVREGFALDADQFYRQPVG